MSTIIQQVIRAPEELAEPELVPLSVLLSEVGSYAAVDNSGSTGGARLRVAKGFVDAIDVNLVSLWNSNCNDPLSSASVCWASMGGTAPHTIFEPKNKVPRNASCFVFMTDGEIYDTARLAQHASLTAHLPSLLVLFRSGNNPSERVASYNVSVVMAHFAAARTAAVLVINNENDPSARVIATKGDWQDALPPALALDDTLLLQECPLVSVQQLQTLPSRVYESMAVGSMPLQDGRVLNLGALLNLQDGRELVADLSETELEDIARAYLARGDLGAWRSRLNMWLSQVNTEATIQAQQWTQHTTNGAHSLLRRLGETENDQERHALRTELQTAMREGALREQEATNHASQAARQSRAILNAALAAVTALERTGMNATSLGRLSNRAARANRIDRTSLASLATLDTEGAPETEDLILLDSGPVALCLRSMTQVELNTGDEALNQALAVGQFRENAVFEPTIVSLSMADRMEELGTSPLTRQSLSVCLPIVSLQDSANRQAVYERLCLVFMDGLAMQHVWLIALSSILRTLEMEPWADPESTPTGRLLHFFATQIMKHTTLPQGSKLSPNAHQPVNTALASILRSEILTVHSSVAEASVILRLLLRFSGPAAFSEVDLRQSMLARIATAIPQMHRNWLQANAVDPWADQGPSSLAALLSSVYQTRLDGGGTHVAVSGSGRIVDSLSDLVSPAAMTAIAAFAQSIRSTVDDLVVPGLTLVVLGTLDRVTAPHVSSSVAVQLVRTAGAATAAEMDPTTAGTSIPDEVLVQVRRRLAWARTPLHPLSPFMSPFGPSVFWFYAIDGTVINMAESFAVVPGEAENDRSSFLLRLTEHLRETRGQLMARYYGTQQSGGFSVRSTTFPMYREMADEFNEMPGTIDLTRPDEVNNYIHRVVQRIVGRSGISSGNTHAEHMERDVTLLLPSLLESVAAFSGNVRAEPRPIPLARRVELELGGRSPDALGDSPPSPIWVPVDDPGLLETLVRVQQTQDRARVNALRRRLTNINHQQRTQGGPAADAQRGLSPSNMGRFQRAVTWFLRHGATETRRDGYVSIQTLVDALSSTFGHATIDQVLEVAETDEKGRLSVIEENGVLFIRANQGHTITTVDPEALMAPIESAADISVCLHGTYEDALVGILRSGGINRMARQAIQMAIGLPDDPLVRSGIRPSVDIVIYIDVDRAMRQHGLRFFRSDNSVICCAGPIPVDCFIKVIRLRDGAIIDF